MSMSKECMTEIRIYASDYMNMETTTSSSGKVSVRSEQYGHEI